MTPLSTEDHAGRNNYSPSFFANIPTKQGEHARTPREALSVKKSRAFSDLPLELPSGKRERIHHHYQKILARLYSRFECPDTVARFCDALIVAVGYHGDGAETIELTDAKIAFANTNTTNEAERFKERFRDWRDAYFKWLRKDPNNPALIEAKRTYDQAEKKLRYTYKLTILDLVREIAQICPTGTKSPKLSAVVQSKVSDFLAVQGKNLKKIPLKKTLSPESQINRALTALIDGFEQKAKAESERAAEKLIFDLTWKRLKEAEKNGSFAQPLKVILQVLKDISPDPVGNIPTPLPTSNPPESLLSCSLGKTEEGDFPRLTNPSPRSESIPLPPAHQFGQPLAEFIERAHATRQRYEAKRCFERQQAAFERSLSLAEVEACNTRKPAGNGPWVQYRVCPICGGSKSGKPRFSLNQRSGGYRCHYGGCEVRGKLREFWENPPTEWREGKRPTITPEQANAKALARAEQEAQDAIERTAKIEKAQNFCESAAQLSQVPAAWDYAQRRTGDAEMAERCGVRYALHHGRKAVVFPAVNQAGEVVALNDRRIDLDEDKTRTKGPINTGIFATPGALDAARVLIVESPLDAVAVAACGFDAIAVFGTSWPEWLPDLLEGKDVLLGFDNDQPDKHGKRAGDVAATKLATELIGRASIQRLKPSRKDWSEIAEFDGLDALRSELEVYR